MAPARVWQGVLAIHENMRGVSQRDRRRRGGPEGPPSNDHQDKLQMIAKNKGTGEAVSDPEEDKQAANPPHHDR